MGFLQTAADPAAADDHHGLTDRCGIFYFQPSEVIPPHRRERPVWKMLLVMVIGATLIPIPISWDIRGWTEMHPLNGPAWSLFFEYIGNILYAVLVRRFSKVLLGLFVFASAVLLVQFAVWGGQGDMIGGWALDAKQLHIGFARLLYPFFAGVLLCRLGKLIQIKYAFGICSLMILAIFSIPRLGGATNLWMNGLYESFAIIFLFPADRIHRRWRAYQGPTGRPALQMAG